MNWTDTADCAMTVCDREGTIVYMNEKSKETFAKYGDVTGHSLYEYHPPRAAAMIRHMLETGSSNSYTITKAGVRKLIHQMPWRDEAGEVAGLVELSILIPDEMPHYDRAAK